MGGEGGRAERGGEGRGRASVGPRRAGQRAACSRRPTWTLSARRRVGRLRCRGGGPEAVRGRIESWHARGARLRRAGERAPRRDASGGGIGRLHGGGSGGVCLGEARRVCTHRCVAGEQRRDDDERLAPRPLPRGGLCADGPLEGRRRRARAAVTRACAARARWRRGRRLGASILVGAAAARQPRRERRRGGEQQRVGGRRLPVLVPRVWAHAVRERQRPSRRENLAQRLRGEDLVLVRAEPEQRAERKRRDGCARLAAQTVRGGSAARGDPTVDSVGLALTFAVSRRPALSQRVARGRERGAWRVGGRVVHKNPRVRLWIEDQPAGLHSLTRRRLGRGDCARGRLGRGGATLARGWRLVPSTPVDRCGGRASGRVVCFHTSHRPESRCLPEGCGSLGQMRAFFVLFFEGRRALERQEVFFKCAALRAPPPPRSRAAYTPHEENK